MIFLNKNENEWIKIPKIQKTRKILALTLIALILISEFAKNVHADDLGLELDADPTTADIGELITFNWTNAGNFDSGWINFGDGNMTVLSDDDDNSTISHKYTTEGTYNVTLYIENNYIPKDYDTDSIIITIKNNPPQFDISLPSEVFEDDEVNVSVVNLVESDHDLQDGVLSYVYDFADGDPITTNTSSIIHKWNNGGQYKVTITVIDDQGALDQKSQYIQIHNKAPDAYFTFAPTSASNNTRSTYYGTYDFRGDIIGEEPEDWEVYDWKDVSDRYNATLNPNGDKLTEWGHFPTPHWSRVDEGPYKWGVSPDGDYIETAHFWSTHQKERFNMETVDLEGGMVTKIVLHAYGKVYDYFYPNVNSQPSSNIYLGGWKGDKVWNFPHDSFGWKTLTWDNLYAPQIELDDLQIQFNSNLWILSELSVNYIDTVYCEIFYTYDMHVSVVNETGYYGQVVQLYDDESGEQVLMENNLPVDQTHGSIEFYVKSDDVTEQTWALCLYDDSTIGLKILMENDQWKYYNGTSDAISECGTPSDDQWYWVRLDFCTSGYYLGLNAHQYRLTVDSSESNIYYFKDINEVNKIRFKSGESDVGIALIDALGYTWSPYYNLNDNKYAVISYPEKTNVQFVANCSDTESDLGPMRYYWDFGDDCSGWGKYVLHNYLESGIYIVNLTCKDDNGKTDWHSEMVIIHNLYPSVMNITCPIGSLTINEGETILFNAMPMDDESDISRLSYWWDFEGYNFDPYNTSNLESGGWIKPHLYMDDYYGNMYVLVKDPETAFGYKAILINVSNVDPLLSIWDASVIANISFEVYKGTPNNNANFTFDLFSNDESVLTELIDTTGDLSTDKTEVAMTLSKIWKVVVNTSDELPSGSWFRCYIKLNFLSGEELVILSPKLYGDEYGYWEVDLNPYFYDNGDYTFMYPITFDAHIWDPSVDDISLSIQYDAFMHLVIDCDNSLPLEDSFSLNNVDYMINVYTENDVQYVNITASQQVLMDNYNDNNFPVSLGFNFTVYPIIDLYELLEIQMELTNLTILHCDTALNYLIGDIWDDDGGEGALIIAFTTDDNIEFENLSPYPEFYIPDQALEGNNVTFYAEISDFDQIREQEDYYVASFTEYDLPTMPDDIELVNGTCDWEGDLFFQDNNLATFNPSNYEHYPATYSFTDDSINSDPQGWMVDEAGGTVQVISVYEGHGQVVELYDTSNTENVNIYQDFGAGAQQYGTVEFWGCLSDVVNARFVFHLLSSTPVGVITLTWDNGANEWRYHNGVGWVAVPNIGTISDNTWFHFTIHFERTIGSYYGLAQNKCEIIMDGVSSGELNLRNNEDPCTIRFLSHVGAYNFYIRVDAVGYSWESDYTIGDNLDGSGKLDFTSTFHLGDVKDDEIIKYLKLFYAYKTDASALVNISIYNFHSESWTLIDSTNVGTDIYRNKYSILSGEYINDTYDIFVKIESNMLHNSFYLDQFKLEYYTSQVSDYGSFEHEFIPDLSSDFTLISGWSDWEGDLNSIDGSYTTFRSCEGKEEVWLMMDEGTGTNAVDSIDQNQNGTIYGASWTIGKLGDYALDFNGSNYDYIDVDYNLPNVGYTTCAWYKTTSVGGHIIGEGLVGESQSTNLQGIVIYSSTQIGYRIEIGVGGNIDYKFTPTGNIIDGQWHFVCAVITSGNLVFYWDDQKFTSSIVNTDTTADNCWIGCYAGPGSGSWFDGPIDDLRIYESALSDDEIEWLYNNGNGREETCRGQTTGIIRPNGDIITQWSQTGLGDHYTLLDEETIRDSKYIWTNYDYKIDELDFESIAYVDTVTKIEIKMYAYKAVASGDWPSVDIYLGGWQGSKTCSWSTSTFTWTSLTWNGLSGSQEDLNGFRFRINSNDAYSSVYLETVYAIVTYIPSTGLSIASNLHLDGVRPIDQIDSVELQYSFKTDIDLDIDLCLYNYSSESWEVVNTSSHTQFTICSYEITDDDYFSPYYDIRVKFERTDSALFEFYLEKLKLCYEWTKGTYEDDYLYSDCPDHPDDFTIYNGTCDSEGCFEAQDNDFFTFNSTAGGDLNFDAVLTLEAAQPSDLIKSLWLNYSYKTDISQSIDISLYNFTANEWYLIDSSTHTSFSNESYIIPISRTEIVNGTEVVYHDFYNVDFDIIVRFAGENQSSEFQLFVDQLKVEYTVVSYLFVGDSSRTIDAVEGDYISFDSDAEHIVDETFDFTLDQLNSHRLGLFELCEVSYSINTSLPQEWSISVYNYTGAEWVVFDSPKTNNIIQNRSFTIISTDFISEDYKVLVQFLAINYSGTAFTLDIYKLDVIYDWSIARADCGLSFLSCPLQIDYTMSSRYYTMFYEDFIFDYAGIYLITMGSDDGYLTTKTGMVINITKVDPFASIGHFTNETIEDKEVYFTSDIHVPGSNATISEYKFFWLFGDGSFSNDPNPKHAYAESGVYNVSLTVIDCYGNSYSDIKNITVVEKAPEIVGPYTFYGVEGQAIILDVDIFDAFLDEIDLEYEWYNSSGDLVSTDKKPSIFLQDGSYKYTLNVTDPLGQTATANISVVVEDAPPIVIIPNYMYSGASVSGNEGFFAGAIDDPGELELTAFGYDTSDNSDLDYYWSIINDNTTYETYELNNGISNTVKFRVKETAVYLGQVKIVSSEKSAVTSFIINSFIDSNGNGISDEFEAMILEFYDNITAYDDTDDDGLTDMYEMTYGNSNYSDPDSDDDGLWDGLHNETGIGEQSLSTKPNDPDCDDDGLDDGTEFFGWNVTTDIFGTIAVNSDPWNNDTDGDGLSDYEEYFYCTNPRTSDTDTDGILDSLDPYPTKYDYDGDGLSDKIELELGTALNVTDTDNDGITDAEEVLGWFKTNPLSADSDHDFASDTAEIQNYRFTIDDRYDLDAPVSLSFEKNCERAASAQIAFMITFGEAINEGDKVYGVQNVPDLNISVIKVDDNLLLFNATTNCTRYYSKVIDFREIMENNSKDYRGEYMIKINNTEAGCVLEQFEIEIAGYLDPYTSDYDGDGIMDGVEMGLLVRGTDIIDHDDLYGESVKIHFPMEETCWWSMDDGTGTTAFDLTSYENNGTLTNMESTDWKTGKIGDYALEFDGVNEFVDCGNEYYLDFERNDTFTLSAWIKTSSTGRAIISKMNTSDNYRGYDVYIDNSGVIQVHLINTLDSNEIIVDGTTTVNDNQWHFITLTYNGSSTASGVKLYIDGSSDNLTIVKDCLNKTIQSDVNFLVGARTEGNYFSGQIDDVRVYSFALTQYNITWLYNSGSGRPSKTLGGVDEPEVKTQYSLEIPYVGVVYDANLTLSIESDGIPIGSGNITIEVVKEELNCSIDDVVLSSASNEFSNTTQFSYEKFIDISPYLNNNSITEFYGKYFLNIEIQGTDYRDKFRLKELYIKTDTFIEAGSTDTEAWLTDPADKDTDGDGWNDYKEIFIKGTNPLSADTDGDGAWDKYDRDPHKDVMLKISPISGTIWYYKKRKLEIIISFKQAGTGESYSLYTLRHWTTVQGETHVSGFPLPYYEWTAYFDGTHGSPDALHYYIDIDDDKLVQGNYLEFKLQLWRINRHWDNKHLSGYDIYCINEVGHSEIVNNTSINEFESVPMKTEAKINITTIGVEKANTIAIYETNGTVFNGHYQEQERMNIIQLYVNDSGAGTPFVEGPNVIAIPTSLFTETIFNAYVQNETLHETPIYSADEEIFKFISVGRDGSTEQACDEIDFVFIRFDISSQDAMEILNLLLECLVNETTNETAIIYSYASTKMNGTSAVMMNLPISVLGFVPWFCDFENSPIGSKPETKSDAFWKGIKKLVSLAVGLIVAIGMAILELVELIGDFIMDILMEWLPILEFILWLIISAIILIFAFIILAISLIMTMSSNLILGIMALILTPFLGAKVKFGLFFVEIGFAQSKIRIDTKVNWKYIEFFRLTLPYLTETIKLNETIIRETKSGILGFFSEEQEIESDTKLDLFNGKYSPNSSSVETVDISFSSEDEHAPDLSFIEQSPTSGLSEDSYTFKVKYSDIDGDAPSEDYGVKLILISPLGEAKEYNMITKDTSPNYETGVVFECVIGDDKDEKLTLAGNWHFYYIAEDINSLKTALIESDETAFDGPTIILDLNSFSTMFFWYNLLCGILPMTIFSIAGKLAYKQQNQYALLVGLIGISIGGIASLSMISNILGDFQTLGAWGKLKYVPIPRGNVEIDPYSGFLGAMLACLFITLALGIVLCHKFDLTWLFDNAKIIKSIKFDLLFIALTIFSLSFPLLLKWIFTGFTTAFSFASLLVSSIILCRNIYGFNWIKKNKDGTMNNNLRYKTVPENVKRLPKIYFGWMTTMTLVFIICIAIMHGYRFNAQIE